MAVLDHSSPVQCVLVLRGGNIITGASDGRIRCWREHQLVGTYSGHTDTVRHATACQQWCSSQ